MAAFFRKPPRRAFHQIGTTAFSTGLTRREMKTAKTPRSPELKWERKKAGSVS
jgi:hypothetical protein